MKTLAVILLLCFIISSLGCKQGGNTQTEVETGTQPEEIIDEGPTQIIGVQAAVKPDDGDYVVDGQAHPFNSGDVYEFVGTSYERATWINGDVFIESGTYELIQTEIISGNTTTYTNYIRFSPTLLTPNNCGGTLASYDSVYTWIANGVPVPTQHIFLDNSPQITQATGWILTTTWAKANLNSACI